MISRGILGGVLLGLGILLSGCVVGNKHQLADATPTFVAAGEYQLAVAVQDQRPFVLDGDKDPNFVGLQRGGFGNPFDVTTGSGKPLAEDFSAAVAKALGAQKFSVKVNTVQPQDTAADITGKLQATGAERLLYLIVRQWKSDTYTNTALLYDLRLSVLGSDSAMLAEKSVVGDEDLGGSIMNPPAHAKAAVPKAFARILEDLFNDPKIVAALK
ncbi:hypothetical protein [Dongia mobilis]|uniref:hypothetical protein n=1 Tax=Dongia sp. TaxID=1977262 RepID=UPI0026F0FD35